MLCVLRIVVVYHSTPRYVAWMGLIGVTDVMSFLTHPTRLENDHEDWLVADLNARYDSRF